MKYCIYQLTCGKAKYIGSSNNFKRRYLQHLKDLKENKHSNDLLQAEFNKGWGLQPKVLTTFNTLFKYQVLTKEQRYINRLSNCNEGTASKITAYSRKEFVLDMIDFVVNHWKLISAILIVVLTVGYGLTTEQANQILQLIVNVYQSIGG
jgi:hypothetical protein